MCGSLLQRFAFEAGLPTEQRVLDEARAGQLLREAALAIVDNRLEIAEPLLRARLRANPFDVGVPVAARAICINLFLVCV